MPCATLQGRGVAHALGLAVAAAAAEVETRLEQPASCGILEHFPLSPSKTQPWYAHSSLVLLTAFFLPSPLSFSTRSLPCESGARLWGHESSKTTHFEFSSSK